MLLPLLLLSSLQLWCQPATSHQQIAIQPVQDELDVGPPTSEYYMNSARNSWTFNFSSPAPHIFSSVHGLLQQWPNTFFPTGHSIVPCQIPAFTNLYHGRQDGELPESPEWVAFDIEMSYGIMGSSRNSHILTYQTTKPTGCLYFDGESATLMGTGQMDTQMLFIYGNVTGPQVDGEGRRFRGLEDEYNRASGLCQWARDKNLGGPGWGVEGIVRMNAGFEMIWCNFTSPSARLLTKLNVTVPLLRESINDHEKEEEEEEEEGTKGANFGSPTYYPLPRETSSPGRSRDPDQPPMPPGWRRDDLEPFLASQAWGWFESATWHYGSSGMGTGRGETRVKPLTCGFLTFYDPIFRQQEAARASIERQKLNLTSDGLWQGPGKDEYRKSALEQLMRRRRYHLLRNISEVDALTMNTAAERVLRALDFHDTTGLGVDDRNCTGMDWIAVSNDIVQRYAPRLQQLRTILEAGSYVDMSNATAVRRWFSGLRQHTHFLLMPYFEYPSYQELPLFSSSTRQLTLSRCKYQYTRLIAPDYHTATLTPEEALVTSAVEETLGNICSWVVDAGFAIERKWFDYFDARKSGAPPLIEQVVDSWRKSLEELMAWLGWVDQWTYCKHGCAWDEVCYIPMWPTESVDPDGRGWGPGPSPGRGRGDGYGYGYSGRDRPPGRHSDAQYTEEKNEPGKPPKRPPGPPFWFVNEDSLWEPKCIKAEYAI
ncbi:hypothetical protein UA08_01844 [Talaromyces atroroseus]|uniref:Enterotoxin n=1 Tax=Talaromyces atroroseus TaxID=1441469 RepID=A0A1Q5QBF9_TALAT|nr:hypothetical protein UA08_01844 [Talaromyces atroroseus]OKL63250.1 hypothetical protein UA08_01844 [Talaromyces atroroseus]